MRGAIDDSRWTIDNPSPETPNPKPHYTAMFKKEFLSALGSGRFLVTAILCLVLIPVGTFVNMKDYERRKLDYAQTQDLLVRRSAMNTPDAGSQAEGYRPPSDLGLWAVGLEPSLPNRIQTQWEGEYRAENDRSTPAQLDGLLFGRVDLLFSAGLVLSLLALVFSHGTIAAEKETGMLRILLSQPVGRGRLLLAKSAGAFSAFVLPLVVAVALTLMALCVSGFSPLTFSGWWVSFVGIMLATLLYLSVIFCFGIFISASTHHSGSAMLASLLAWSVLILALPRTVPSLADLIVSVPPRTIVDLQKSVVRRSIDERRIAECDQVLDTLVQKLMAVAVPDTLASIDNASPEWSARLADIEAKYKPIAARYGRETDSLVSAIDEDFRGRQQQQARVSRALSLFSPLSSYTYLMTALCSTGTLEMANLEQNARDFQRKADEEYYSRFIFRRYGYRLSINTALRTLDGTQGREGPKLPLLEYRTMTIGTILAKEWMDVGILLLAPLALLWASYRKFLRYDAR